MMLFNSSTRVRKKRRHLPSTPEPQGVQSLLARVQSGERGRTGGAIVAFTSANQGEGVSYAVQYFAETLASQTGRPTLVVKAERLRSLRVTDFLNKPGMRTRVGNLWSVPPEASGNANGRGNGTGMALDHEKLREPEKETGPNLLQALGDSFAYTLIDCPAISSSDEAAMLAPNVHGVVLVVEADRTKRDQIFRARQTVEMAKGNLMGLVLNRRRHVVPEWFYRRL